MPILETKNLCKSFGALQAVSNVSLQMEEGSLTSVIGPNGAGKTTLFNLISGRYVPDTARSFSRRKYRGAAAPRAGEKGYGKVISDNQYLSGAHGIDECLCSADRQLRKKLRLSARPSFFTEILEEASAIVESVRLADYTEYRGSALSHGDRKLLEFAMVLAMKPIIMLLDEPTAG